MRNEARLQDLDFQLKRVIAYEEEAKQEEKQKIKHLELREQQRIKGRRTTIKGRRMTIKGRSKEAERRSKEKEEEEFRIKKNLQYADRLQVVEFGNKMFSLFPDRLNLSEETKSQFDQIEQTIIGFQNQITEKRTK